MIAPMQKVYTTEQLKLVYNKNKAFEGSTWDPCQIGN